MRLLLCMCLSIVFFGFSSTISADDWVDGYTKSDGSYVSGHYRSSSNNTNVDNYSTKGNYNPYSGTNGSKAADYSTAASNYGSGQPVYTGPKGGQYYYNSNGNKTYVPKSK